MPQDLIGDLSIPSFRAGDEQAFRAVFGAYKHAIHFFIFNLVQNRTDATDITSDVFHRLWLHREKMDTVARIKNFLYTVARNACIDRLRRRNNESMHITLVANPEEISPQPDGGEYRHDHAILQSEIMHEFLLACIDDETDKLPPRCKQIFRLHYKEDLAVKEIATLLHLRSSSIYQQLDIACHRIRMALLRKGLDKAF